MFKRLLHFLRVDNETGILPLLIGAGLSAAGSYLGNQKKTITDPYGTLSPEAKAMYQSLGPQLTANATADPSTFQYGGDFTAPIGAEEQAALDRSSRLNALSEPTFSALMNPLDQSGMLGSAMSNYFNDSIYKPAMKSYQEDIAPQIEEQYAGSDGYWGGARAGAVARGYRDLADSMASQRSQLAWNSLQNAGNAANQYASAEAANQQLQQIPRMIQQYGLDQKYKDFLAANDRSQSYINDALNFLNINTVTQTTKDKYGVLPYILGAAGSAISGSEGMWGGGGGTSSSGTNTFGGESFDVNDAYYNTMKGR